MKPTSLLVPLALLVGCQPDTEFTEQKRVLDSFPYVDCGAIAPNTRQVCTVPLFSQESGGVTIFDIEVEGISGPEGGVGEEGAFIVRDEDWLDPTCDDGTCRVLEGYDDESDADTLPLPITFAPLVEGEYQAELTIWSNDNQTDLEAPLPTDEARSETVWKVQLRGLARPACGRVWPTFIDMGKRVAPGAEFTTSARIENCGIVTLVVASFPDTGTGAEEMTVTTPAPLYILPGLSEEIAASWIVGTLTNGEPTPVQADVGFVSNAPDTLDVSTLTILGNTCDGSVLGDWDADGDGWFVCGGDCADTDATRSPSDTERAGNGTDDDCDGTVDEATNPVGTDDDGDGFTESAGDCDDTDPAISPDGVEVLNQVDDDCDGTVDDSTELSDDDADGFSEREGDIDDTNRFVYPGAVESGDGIDNDGDGIVDEGTVTHDDDQDGYIEQDDPVANDCDDFDPWVYVGAFEFCDGYDNDCDDVVDEGPDDAPDGACAFLPDRKAPAVVQEQTGCASAGGGAALIPGLVLVGLGLAAARRRDARGD